MKKIFYLGTDEANLPHLNQKILLTNAIAAIFIRHFPDDFQKLLLIKIFLKWIIMLFRTLSSAIARILEINRLTLIQFVKSRKLKWQFVLKISEVSCSEPFFKLTYFLVTFSYFFFPFSFLILQTKLFDMSKFIFCCIALRQAFFYSLTFIVFGTLLLPSCQEAGSMEDAAKAQTTSVAIAERITPVRLATAQEKSFALQTLANGKVNALLQSKLYFKSQGTIEKISVSNGSLVKAGQVLAVLDNRQQAIALEQAKNLYRKAINDLNIEIVNYGGIDRDTNSVKPRILEALKVKVAYNEALTSIKNAKLQYDNTFLIAPYKGVIANLKAKPHNPAPTNEPFCTLLNTDNLIVEIAALEAELAHIQIGQNAQINPIALAKSGVPPSYNGNVIEINPMVSEQGLVLVKIKINKVDKDLIEGMNVNVSIEKNLEKQIIIPKAAVVERSGRKVVFTYENGLAKWHYVVVAYENSTEIAISEGLKAGEQVIIDGNLNLGHDAPVEVVKDDK